ncbi:ribonuclease P protein component [Helicobacter kayseriensis]|uniref:ribonuclease P protein component n=1 Tax=Helicobacter kayseriensis TaxID=2905877 RepID=UPI001E2AA2C8|nr:ribonuclease P protein component [Helicobacter kayseriensis]MCE3047460.1 ribonuclease P protein component [Helicobacter kayseriensis]MCE3048807.1 ribonuclease P protein component [Helicobacter kayseriensis]
MKTLKNKAEFDLVYKNGKRYDRGCFRVYILLFSHSSLGERRLSFKERSALSHFISQKQNFYFGLSVSKKVGNAPVRNKIKRWFRAFCRNYESLLEGRAMIFVAKDFQSMEYALIQEEMLKILNKSCA